MDEHAEPAGEQARRNLRVTLDTCRQMQEQAAAMKVRIVAMRDEMTAMRERLRRI